LSLRAEGLDGEIKGIVEREVVGGDDSPKNSRDIRLDCCWLSTISS